MAEPARPSPATRPIIGARRYNTLNTPSLIDVVNILAPNAKSLPSPYARSLSRCPEPRRPESQAKRRRSYCGRSTTYDRSVTDIGHRVFAALLVTEDFVLITATNKTRCCDRPIMRKNGRKGGGTPIVAYRARGKVKRGGGRGSVAVRIFASVHSPWVL